jgi:hypothetical protein
MTPAQSYHLRVYIARAKVVVASEKSSVSRRGWDDKEILRA